MKFIPNAVAVQAARSVLLARKHSPVIMFGAGVAGSLTATVLACKATLKLEDVLNDAEHDREKAEQARVEHPERYSEDDQASDERTIRLRTMVNIAKLYAPAVGVGVLSYGLLTGAHVVLTKRNASLAAAYIAVDKAFKEYRARVRDELGEEKDRDFRFGSTEKEIVEETETGPQVSRVRQIKTPVGLSMYAKPFDQLNENWEPVNEYNLHFIRCQQKWANDRLRSRGHVFLNEVYDALGMDHTKEGAVVGWVWGNGDNFIDFGLGNDNASYFMTGDDNAVWLDFNVDGPVWNLI
jgi:hypothetical protein